MEFTVNTNNTIVIQANQELSLKLETLDYNKSRIVDIITRLMSKNVPLSSTGLSQRIDELVNLCAEYDDIKDKISTEVVIPRATAEWGKYAEVSWTLTYNDAMISVAYTNSVYKKSYKDIATVDSELNDTLRNLSVARAAYTEIYDKLVATYPTIDNETYKEFMKKYDSTEFEYDQCKKKVDSNYVTPKLVENNLNPNDCEWNLKFATATLDIFERVGSAEEADAE